MIDIYVINLKERNDRWEHIENTFGKIFNIIRVDAVKNDDGVKGCFMSHKKCIKIAKEKNLKNIIVLEDDCTISNEYRKNFFEKFKEIYDFLENYSEWDIFLGGTTNLKYENILKKIVFNNNKNTLLEINRGNTTHFIVYNNTCYDFFLNQEMNIQIDCVWHNKLRGLTVYPLIANQLNKDKSDIINQVVNYSFKFRKTNKILMEYITKNL